MVDFSFGMPIPEGMLPDGFAEALRGQEIAGARAPRFGEEDPGGRGQIVSDVEMLVFGVLCSYVRHDRLGTAQQEHVARLMESAEIALTGDLDAFLLTLRAADAAMLAYGGLKPSDRLAATRVRDWSRLIAGVAALAEALRIGDDIDEHAAMPDAADGD